MKVRSTYAGVGSLWLVTVEVEPLTRLGYSSKSGDVNSSTTKGLIVGVALGLTFCGRFGREQPGGQRRREKGLPVSSLGDDAENVAWSECSLQATVKDLGR
jgi:hypothetical protein